MKPLRLLAFASRLVPVMVLALGLVVAATPALAQSGELLDEAREPSLLAGVP